MNPTIGRIVHFVGKGGVHFAAIVTAVPGSGVNLTIFDGFGGVQHREAVSQDEARETPGTWHWPEKDE